MTPVSLLHEIYSQMFGAIYISNVPSSVNISKQCEKASCEEITESLQIKIDELGE